MRRYCKMVLRACTLTPRRRLTKEGKMDSDNKLFELRELCLNKVFVAGVINWMQRMRSMGDKRMAWSKT